MKNKGRRSYFQRGRGEFQYKFLVNLVECIKFSGKWGVHWVEGEENKRDPGKSEGTAASEGGHTTQRH